MKVVAGGRGEDWRLDLRKMIDTKDKLKVSTQTPEGAPRQAQAALLPQGAFSSLVLPQPNLRVVTDPPAGRDEGQRLQAGLLLVLSTLLAARCLTKVASG